MKTSEIDCGFPELLQLVRVRSPASTVMSTPERTPRRFGIPRTAKMAIGSLSPDAATFLSGCLCFDFFRFTATPPSSSEHEIESSEPAASSPLPPSSSCSERRQPESLSH
jgi:hypothetical protein